MARIRSIHPGFFTDEAVVSASPQAQVFLIGLWCQCDDQGVFEWKPLTLKMRILPAASCDVALLLGELGALDIIKQVDVGSLKYGLVRNFRKYQRPKKPNSTYPLAPEFRSYVGLDDPAPEQDDDEGGASPPPVPHQAALSSEIAPQMEEEGGRRKREERKGDSVAVSPPVAARGAPGGASHTQPNPLTIPPFLRATGRAQLITEAWQPSDAAIAALRKGRPDLVGKLYDDRMQDFREWCSANATMSHNAEATWSSFMRKTRLAHNETVEGETHDQKRIRLAKEAIHAP